MKRKVLFPIMMIVLMIVSIIAFATQRNAAVADNSEGCRMDICHKGKTINISCTAFPAHFSHGDTPSACN